MFAVFQSGGKQHRVTEGDVLRLELLESEPGNEIVFDKVLMVAMEKRLAWERLFRWQYRESGSFENGTREENSDT